MAKSKLFFDAETKNNFGQVINKKYKVSTPKITCEEITDGYILPAKKDGAENIGGVVDKSGKFIKTSAFKRVFSGSLTKAYKFDKKEAVSKDVDVMYAGVIINHFGHFLVEGTSRLWWLAENLDKNVDIAFLMPKNQKIFPQFWEFMELLGFTKERIHIVKKITKFRKIYVPVQAHVFTDSYNDKFIEAFQYLGNKITDKNSKRKFAEKLYLSRTHFKKGTLCLGEKQIERIFKNNGYHILYPEKLSLEEQIAYIRNAKDIVGVAGTALHMVLFANKGITVTELERSDFPALEQSIINEALNCKAYYVGTNQNPFPVDHSIGPSLIGLTSNLEDYCKERGFSYDKKSVNKIKASDAKAFLKEWLILYSQTDHNKVLQEKASLIGRRILHMGCAFLPLRKRIKQYLKSIERKIRNYKKSKA